MTFRIALRVTLGFSALLLFLAVATAQDVEGKKSFEGLLTVQTQDVERVQFFTYSIKDGKLRIEGADREDADPIVLVDYWVKKTFVILPGKEQFVQFPSAPDLPGAKKSKVETEIQKTESTDEILNFSCDQFLVNVDQGQVEVWATKQLGIPGTFITTVTLKTLELTPWQSEILGMGYFPLKVIMRDSTGDEQNRFTVTAVQRKDLAESLFRVPSSYEMVNRDALQPKQPPKKKKSR